VGHPTGATKVALFFCAKAHIALPNLSVLAHAAKNSACGVVFLLVALSLLEQKME
jgi:hypothetical protein